MSWERYGGLRAALAQLAAQIMYGEDVKQYFTAKRLAAKRLLKREGARTIRYRPQDLPSNGEIKQALLELVTEIEGDARTQRLFAMRVVALEAMAELTPFSPRLIGSVATGHVRSGSDVDLHVFAWDASDVVAHVRSLGWAHDTERVSILKHGKVMEFTHVHVADVFPIELTVYPPNELRNRPRSSTDGKPIVRVRDAALRKLCEAEHPELYRRYVETGEVPSLDDILAAEDQGDGGDGALDLALAEDADDEAWPPDLVDPWSDDGDAAAATAGEGDGDAGAGDDEDEREPRLRRVGRGGRRPRGARERSGME